MSRELLSDVSPEIQRHYRRLPDRVARARHRRGRPLTLAEKILHAHLRAGDDGTPSPGGGDVELEADRVALQDALAQIVALQFMTAGLDEVVVPTTIHCDHLVQARSGAGPDLRAAVGANAEVYDFLRAVGARYGMGFWEPGTGIIHQVVLENLAFPGGLMVGTDSHTPNAGGVGTFAVGVGGGDAIDVMTGGAFTLRWPRRIGVHLSGSLSGWASPKDVILHLAGVLTTSGGTGAVIEYFGPGVSTISATGRATICNMGAEVGATTSLFPYDEATGRYLRATGRPALADAADDRAEDLRADPEVERDPERAFDQLVDIDLASLTPLVNGPGRPDLVHRVGAVGRWAQEHGVPLEVAAALVGSCTNSSYEDIARAASVARRARERGLRVQAPLFVTPGSERVRATVERDGLLGELEGIGATVLANACGPCIGQWDRAATPARSPAGAPNTIVTSFNRNFPRRNDGRAETNAFVTSPEMVVAYALAGTLAFDPRSDTLAAPEGGRLQLDEPGGAVLPARGFAAVAGPRPAPAGAAPTEIAVSPTSERLQLLEPFAPWDGADFVSLPVLVKARGRCTTDHISPAGPWLAFRGHLERISANLFLGVENAFTGAVGRGVDSTDGVERSFPETAARWGAAGVRWCVIGDENYGEGSSREHAAMEPRYRGAAVVLARSFARIHETNLKRQGLLALTFEDPATYDHIGGRDHISVVDLQSLDPDRPVRARIEHADGTVEPFRCRHTYSAVQLAWFRAGSALNVIRDGRIGRDTPSPRPSAAT